MPFSSPITYVSQEVQNIEDINDKKPKITSQRSNSIMPMSEEDKIRISAPNIQDTNKFINNIKTISKEEKEREIASNNTRKIINELDNKNKIKRSSDNINIGRISEEKVAKDTEEIKNAYNIRTNNTGDSKSGIRHQAPVMEMSDIEHPSSILPDPIYSKSDMREPSMVNPDMSNIRNISDRDPYMDQSFDL
jgi:hypothetical protein